MPKLKLFINPQQVVYEGSPEDSEDAELKYSPTQVEALHRLTEASESQSNSTQTANRRSNRHIDKCTKHYLITAASIGLLLLAGIFATILYNSFKPDKQNTIPARLETSKN